MKKIIITLTAIAAIIFLLTCCDKYHRDRYTGNWEFTTVRIYYNQVEDVDEYDEVKRDTVNYIGKITLGNYENQLFIKYTGDDEAIVSINENGSIYHNGYWYGKYPTGGFKSKNILCLHLFWGEFIPFEGETERRSDYIVGTKKGRR